MLPFAAAPTLRFMLRIEAASGQAIRSVALNTQVRIAAERRSYDERATGLLAEVFGEPRQWSTTLRNMFWTQTTLMVPSFTGSTLVEMPVPCTYDFEVAASKYFHAVEDGDIPLEFLFSGSVFYVGEAGGLRTGRISWDKEARFRMPARLWHEMMHHYFPNSAWLRLRKEVFDRLYAFKAAGSLPTWEDAIDALLRARERDPEA